MRKLINIFLITSIFISINFVGVTVVYGKVAIPKVRTLEQISPNQIRISYDTIVDLKLGTKATNYWVQDRSNVEPKGIATLGKNDSVNSKNSLTSNLVTIKPVDGSRTLFILTFNQDIPKGAEYKLIICYVTSPGAPPYNGDNGTVNFVGK